jgi:heme exporter protein CcmD
MELGFYIIASYAATLIVLGWLALASRSRYRAALRRLALRESVEASFREAP